MKIIAQNPTPGGGYSPIQDGNLSAVPDGVAVWPDMLPAEVFYQYSGFVTLDIQDVDGMPTVVSYEPNIEAWEAWRASMPPAQAPEDEPPHEPTMEELEAANKRLSAQVTMLQEQQTFLEECLLEMAEEVYA